MITLISLCAVIKCMRSRIDVDERLRVIDMGGCWYAEEIETSFSTYSDMVKHYSGPYRYLCSHDVKIEDPKKYEFFNPDTNRGYVLPGSCWFSDRLNTAYDSLEECSRHADDCKCTCTKEYEKAFKLESEIPNKKSRVARERKRDEKGHFI